MKNIIIISLFLLCITSCQKENSNDVEVLAKKMEGSWILYSRPINYPDTSVLIYTGSPHRITMSDVEGNSGLFRKTFLYTRDLSYFNVLENMVLQRDFKIQNNHYTREYKFELMEDKLILFDYILIGPSVFIRE